MFGLYTNREASEFGNLFKKGYEKIIFVAKNEKELNNANKQRYLSILSSYKRLIQHIDCNYWELQSMLNSKISEGSKIHINQDNLSDLKKLISSSKMQHNKYFKVDIQIFFSKIEKENKCYINIYNFQSNLITRSK